MADESQIELTEKMNELLREQLRIRRALGRAGAVSMRELADEAERGDKSTSDMTESLREAAEGSEEFGDAAEETGEKSSSISEFFDRMKERAKEFWAALTNMAQAVFNFGKSLYNLWSGAFILDGLIAKANELPINTAFAEAREEVREFAGDLGSGLGQSIMTSFENFRKGADGFGLSMSKVYGFGTAGNAARLKDVKDLYEKLGSSVSNLSEKLEEFAGELVFTGKALGIGNEGVAQMLKTAEAIGTDGVKYVRSFQQEAAKSLGTYGISAKIMGRGMNELLKTLPHLAREGAKAFAPIVAYAQKMGLELKQVTGILDTFSSADKALEAASNLAQIGVALDPLELIAEKDPAKMLMKIGDAFKYSGKQIDLNDRHQRSYIKSTLQIDDATLDRLASENGLAESYKKTAANAEIAKKKQMSQQEVMEELGKGIKRLIQVLDKKNLTGFFDALIQGFSDGAMNLGPMLHTMYYIKNALLEVYHVGRQLGVMFMRDFPGIQEMLGGIMKLFDHAAIEKFLGVISSSFGKLTDALNKAKGANPKKAIDDFFDSLKAGFQEYSESTGSFWKNIMPGLKKFSAAMGPVLAGIIRFIARNLAEGMKYLANLIKNGFSSDTGGGGGLLGDFGEVLKNLLKPIWESLVESWPILWNALSDLFSTLWEAIKPVLIRWGNNFLDWMSRTWDNLARLIRVGWNAAPGAASRLWESIKDALATAWDKISQWFEDVAYPKLVEMWDWLTKRMIPRIKWFFGDMMDNAMLEMAGSDSAALRYLAGQMAGFGHTASAAAAAGDKDLINAIKTKGQISKTRREYDRRELEQQENAEAAVRKADREKRQAQREADAQAREATRQMQQRADEQGRTMDQVLQDQQEGMSNAASVSEQFSSAAEEHGSAVVKLSEDVVTANNVLASTTAPGSPYSNLMSSWNNGQLQVSHNIPNTQVSLAVNIDSRNLISNLCEVNVGTADQPAYMSMNKTESKLPDRSTYQGQ